MAKDFDRYEIMKNDDGTLNQMPYISISIATTDKYVEWNVGRSRMDKLSQSYYGTPFYDWIILYANPEYISEFDIPDNVTIRIPFPLDRVKSEYQSKLKNNRRINNPDESFTF